MATVSRATRRKPKVTSSKPDDISHIVLIRFIGPDGKESGNRRIVLPQSAARFLEAFNSTGENYGSGYRAEAKRIDLPDLSGDWDALSTPTDKGNVKRRAKGGAR